VRHVAISKSFNTCHFLCVPVGFLRLFKRVVIVNGTGHFVNAVAFRLVVLPNLPHRCPIA
jgi:hypothetical protein